MVMTNDVQAAENHMSGTQMTEAQFVSRFAEHCKKVCGFTHFDDGMSVDDYCEDVAKSYYADIAYREDGPEACAESDMSYWGEE